MKDKTKKPKDEPREIEPDFPPEEIARRRDETVRRMIQTPPKRHEKQNRDDPRQ